MATKDDKFKLTSGFKDFLNAGKKDSRVLKKVERYVLSKPTDTSRRSDVLHPSAIIKDDWCHRGAYFQLIGFPPPPFKITLSKSRVFQVGHDIHSAWQTTFAQMGTLWGRWECPECKHSIRALATDERLTKSCEKGCWSKYGYKEVPLVYEPLRIHGHADGILLGFGDPLLLEIKSVGTGTFRFEAPGMMVEHNGNLDKMWDALEAPFMSHILQAGLYMKLAELSNLEHQPQESLFLYENKSNQSVKEFVIKKSDFGLTHILEAAAFVVKSAEEKAPPICNIAPNSGCTQCKGYQNV